MNSSRDTYGIKTLRPGEIRRVPGKTRNSFRHCLAMYVQRHPNLLRRVFDWKMIDGVLEIRRVM